MRRINLFFQKTSIVCVVIFALLTSSANAQPPMESFADLVETLTPAVVNISTVQNIQPKNNGQNMGDMQRFPEGSPFDDFFKEFFDRFGQYQNQPRQVRSLGSGFILDAKKQLVVTNNHVIQDADEVVVILKDGTEIKAEVLGQDPESDLALLKIKTNQELQAVKFGSSEDMRVGDWILAIGNPFGLGGTVTAGIVSARARDININPYIDYIQTDASINQGNSGGPMFNMKGEVVGINTVILAPGGGGSVGIGFAIPSDTAKNVITQLEKYGKAKRGWLGVRIQDIGDDIAESLALKSSKGVLLGDVFENSPAQAAGLKMGDVILSFNGKEVENVRKLQRMVSETEIGNAVTLGVWRQGKKIDIKVTIEELDQAQRASLAEDAEPQIVTQSQKVESLGFEVTALTKSLKELYKILPETQGVLITKITPEGSAADKGLSPGDVIVEAGMMAVNTPKDLIAQIDRTLKSGRKSILLLVERKGTLSFVALPIKK